MRTNLQTCEHVSFKRGFTCKMWRRYSRERASQSLPKISQMIEKIRKNIGEKASRTESQSGSMEKPREADDQGGEDPRRLRHRDP